MRRLLVLLLLLALPAGAEERLVELEQTVFGLRAVIRPEFDFTVPQRQVYTVVGGDSLAGLGKTPVRLSGDFGQGQVKVAGFPTLVAAHPVPQGAWRGRVRAKVVSLEPPQVELVEQGQKAGLQLETGEQQAAWRQWTPGQKLELEAIFFQQNGQLQAVAPRFLPVPTLSHSVAGPLLRAQLSEDFLHHCAREFLIGHQLNFREPNTGVVLEVSDLGISMLGCKPGQLSVFGALRGELAGSQVTAQFETRTTPHFEGGQLVLRFEPGQTRLALVDPWPAAVPAQWLGLVEGPLFEALGNQLSLPVPQAYEKELLATGALTADDLKNLSLVTQPLGDRRRNLLVIAASRGTGPSVDLQNRELGGQEFSLWLSSQVVSRGLRAQVPPLLPMTIPIPKDKRPKQQVFVFTVQVTDLIIRRLDLAYADGVLVMDPGEFDVKWTAGITGGLEPGARATGHFVPHLAQGLPLRWSLQPVLTRIEFLSPQIRSKSAAEQEAIKQKIVTGLGAAELPMPVPDNLPVPPLSGRAGLQLTGFEAQSDGLLLRGRLLP
ncbi:MAG: hypothetical protein KC910_07680 [Candidatus Eremiobacteraeota bacterium]|nr:hypothetical protein [Candidatus Eremiobacteraeota bacterium]